MLNRREILNQNNVIQKASFSLKLMQIEIVLIFQMKKVSIV
jgi:hypothetical protein